MVLERPTVVTSCDYLSDYITYIPILSRAWSRFSDARVRVICIAPQSLQDDLASILSEYADIRFAQPMGDLNLGVQAKLERLWQTQLSDIRSAFNVIVDMDMVPLSDIYQRLVLSRCPEVLVKWRFDHPDYNHHSPQSKWPMHGTGAPGHIWRDILNPSGEDLSQAILRWTFLNVDGMESPQNSFGAFSDESLLRAIVLASPTPPPVMSFSAASVKGDRYGARLDRADKFVSRSALKRLAPGLLIRSGRSQEFHGPSKFPFHDNRGRAIMRHVGVDRNGYRKFLADLWSLLGRN